ncbi:MAG: hypothetical protein MJZ41_06785 [Bacteroidaceae bacterium]|nr:hypothetical protein [Bacteroidaceae bacterium]
MRKNYFFAPVFKKIGWAMFIPSVIIIIMGLCGCEMVDTIADALSGGKVFSVIPIDSTDMFAVEGAPSIGGMTFFVDNESWLDEIVFVFAMMSVIFIGFASEKEEDECMLELRTKSLMWSVKVYGCFFIAGVMLIYGFPFVKFVIVMPLILFVLYIAKFNYELYKFRKEASDEE